MKEDAVAARETGLHRGESRVYGPDAVWAELGDVPYMASLMFDFDVSHFRAS